MSVDPLKIAEEDFSFALEAMIRAKGYQIAPAADLPAPNVPTASTNPERRIPQNDFELKQFLFDEFGIRLPDTKVCEHHTTPFRAFADAYFARYGVTVWKASRGLGGKSYLLALLGHCEALTLDADVTILGGSGEQSARVLEYLQKWSTEEHNIKRRTLYGDGGRVTALMASSKSARGPHPQRLRMDECLARGSRVATPLGWRDIATLLPGDRVYSWHEGRIVITTVRRTWNRGWRDTFWCDIEGEGFYATPEHPVLSGNEWRRVQEAPTVQAVPWLWKSDPCGGSSRPRPKSALHGVLPEERHRSKSLSMPTMRRTQDFCRQGLPHLSFYEQGSGGLSLRRLREATSLCRLEAMPTLSPQMDEHDGDCAICGGACDSARRSTTQQSGKSDGRTSNALRIEIQTAGSDQSVDCRFSDRQNHYRSSRRILARSADGNQARHGKEEISYEGGLCSPVLPNRSDALLVAKPLKTSQGPTLEVFDITTDTGSFIAWPGVVVHNCDEMDVTILDAAMGQPMASQTVPKQTVMSSTHHYADKTFTEILRRAAEKAWPIYEWCYKESSASPNGWLSQAEVQSKRGEVTAAMWDAEYDLQEPSPEGRAILPEAVDACFKKKLGEFEGKLGEEVVIEEWEQGRVYAHGADWAKKKDFTIIDTFRIDVRPMRRVAWLRTGRMAWPMMIAKFNERVRKYGGNACHDATGLGDVVGDYQDVNAEGVILSGQTRSDVFSKYIAAIENGTIESPAIRYCEGEHRYCTNEDLTGSGHPPDSFVAGAMAFRAANKKRKGRVWVGV